MKTIIHQDEAVSPVVGVMLMLVVTIIIAAVVAGFTSGMSSEEQTAPHLTFTVTPAADYADTDKTNAEPNTPSLNNGIKFRLSGGESVSLKDIRIELQSGVNTMKFDTGTVMNSTASVDENNKITIIKTDDGENSYFAVSPSMTDLISVGDTFTLLADYTYDSTLAADAAIEKGRFIAWSPKDSYGVFTAKQGVPVKYAVYDKKSNKQIQTGTVTFK